MLVFQFSHKGRFFKIPFILLKIKVFTVLKDFFSVLPKELF